MEHGGVQEGGEEVVGGADGVDVAGQVEVHVFHGHYLAEAAAGASAFDTEHGAEGGLPQGHDCGLADVVHPLRQADGGGGLAFAQGSGRDGGDDYVFGVGVVLAALDDVEADLGLLRPVQLDIVAGQAHHPGDFLHGLEPGRVGDFQVRAGGCAEFWILNFGF